MDSVRIDKWLWAARFFKTRSLASKAVAGGKVHLNGGRIKASKTVVPGDSLVIQRVDDQYTVMVLALSDRRGPAKVAQTLYEETAESLAARQDNREARRLSMQSSPAPKARPDKRARRLIHRFKETNRE
ncbi:MAG: S4 domain-containing protein [Gammaproteobacteria bacterium]|nr:S4 domain-containing protein [Gammaproteobacteria bacterium]